MIQVSSGGRGEAYARYSDAYDLHVRDGRAAAAEALYRDAIAGGFAEAGYNLGLLLRDLGRDAEAEASLRAAVSVADPEVASRAALAVARMLDRRHEPSAARRFYLEAIDRGSGAVRENAAVGLAVVLVADGERERAAALLETAIKSRYLRSGSKITDASGQRFAALLMAVIARPRGYQLVRRIGSACYRARLRHRRRRLTEG